MVGRPLKAVTKALTADSFRELAEQPFVNPSSGPASGRISDSRFCDAASLGRERTKPTEPPALPETPLVTIVTVFPELKSGSDGGGNRLWADVPDLSGTVSQVLLPATTSHKARLPTCYGFFLDASHIC